MDSRPVTITSTENGSHKQINLGGTINEVADFSSLTFDGITDVTLDLGGINYINSAGISQWTKFIKSMENVGAVKIVNCPAVLLDQVQIFPDFFGAKKNIVIHDCFIPYRCPSCDHDNRLLVTAETITNNHKLPDFACPDCQSAMEPEFEQEDLQDFLPLAS